jgi:hypothetical protein
MSKADSHCGYCTGAMFNRPKNFYLKKFPVIVSTNDKSLNKLKISHTDAWVEPVLPVEPTEPVEPVKPIEPVEPV